MTFITKLLNEWDIYSWYLLLCAFVCSNIVSCQSFNDHIIELFKPFSTHWSTNFGCNDYFTFMRQMFQIPDSKTHSCEVAWSQSATPSCLHSLMIFCIIISKWTRALSIGTFKLGSSLNPSTSFVRISLSFVMVMPLMLIVPFLLSISSSSSSLRESPSFEICHKFWNMGTNLQRSYPYHVPSYLMIINPKIHHQIYVTITMICYLHKFIHNVHTHVQHAYQEIGYVIWYVTLTKVKQRVCGPNKCWVGMKKWLKTR